MLFFYGRRRRATLTEENVQDFLIKLDIKPLIHLLEISIFSLNNGGHYLVKNQNYEQLCQRSQNSEFQSHFSVSKIDRIFLKKKSAKNI